ncbi:MAG: family 43 glycosylhydrolase, partial [Lachnospiraceae bacterium]
MKQAYNPYLPGREYIPDGEPHIFGDRVYLYGSHDRFGADKFCVNDYVCWSAKVTDLADWRYEGVIYQKRQDPHSEGGRRCLYAPDVVQGPDQRFYLYYALDDLGIMGVAVSDTPAGQYTYLGDVHLPNGHVLGSAAGDLYQFDPGIFRDEDGRIYLYSGFGIGEGTEQYFHGLKANGMYVMELENDMVTVKSGPNLVIPANLMEGKKDHGFFEASSMRRIGGKYYFIYSSSLSHELCYRVSDRPDGGFGAGHTLVSNGDIGFKGRTLEHRLNHIGNTHGSLIEIEGQWYVFYHRQTNHSSFSRQGLAEKVTILPDGSIPQAECTSCGL